MDGKKLGQSLGLMKIPQRYVEFIVSEVYCTGWSGTMDKEMCSEEHSPRQGPTAEQPLRSAVSNGDLQALNRRRPRQFLPSVGGPLQSAAAAAALLEHHCRDDPVSSLPSCLWR
jgi:hypothetical protein